jgi:PII-like signaling protein
MAGQGAFMVEAGPALEITILLNADTSSHSDFPHKEILRFLHENGVSGATVFKPHAGFGSHRRLHTAGAGGVAGEHLPVKIEFIESKDKVKNLLPDLFELVTDGLIEAKETTILKVTAGANSNPSRL